MDAKVLKIMDMNVTSLIEREFPDLNSELEECGFKDDVVEMIGWIIDNIQDQIVALESKP